MITSAPDLLVEAAAYRRVAQPLGLALACEDASAVLVAAGRGDEARTPLREARDLYDRIGAGRGTARVAAALRGLGMRRGSRAPRIRAATGWDALTGTERKVTALVAQRLSNPEIAERLYLSRRTVGTRVRSRMELAAEAARIRMGQDLAEDRQQLQPADERQGSAAVDRDLTARRPRSPDSVVPAVPPHGDLDAHPTTVRRDTSEDIGEAHGDPRTPGRWKRP